MPLNNQTSADNYTAANSLEVSPPASKCNLVVANAAVFVQFSDGGGMLKSQAWLPETFYPPGYYNLNNPTGTGVFNAVRFRSAVAGTPGQVTVSAI